MIELIQFRFFYILYLNASSVMSSRKRMKIMVDEWNWFVYIVRYSPNMKIASHLSVRLGLLVYTRFTTRSSIEITDDNKTFLWIAQKIVGKKIQAHRNSHRYMNESWTFTEIVWIIRMSMKKPKSVNQLLCNEREKTAHTSQTFTHFVFHSWNNTNNQQRNWRVRAANREKKKYTAQTSTHTHGIYVYRCTHRRGAFKLQLNVNGRDL